MKVCALILTVFLTNYFSVNAQVDSFDAKILHYLDINGTDEQYIDAYDSMFVMLRKKYTGVDVPESFWAKIQSDRSEKVAEVKKMLAFAYRNNFTESDIDKMTVFYETETGQQLVANPRALSQTQNNKVAAFNNSEVGKKITEKRTSLTEDITKVSQDWSRDLFIDKMTALTKFGYKPLKPKPKEKKQKKQIKKTTAKPLSDQEKVEKAKSAKLANPDN